MRKFYAAAALIAFALSALAQQPRQQQQRETFSPPPLNTVGAATLSPSYSCRPPAEFEKGYRKTALFLSELVRRYNSPDLLFNGACGSEDYFSSATHGANTSVIADLGPNVPLENVPPLEAMPAPAGVGAGPRFKHSAPVKVGHTYVVRLDKRRLVEGWFVFTVSRHEPNKLVEISYSVRGYRLLDHGIPPPARADDASSLPDK